jgi:hypothetical protein
LNEVVLKTTIACTKISIRQFTSEIDLLPIQITIYFFPFVKEIDGKTIIGLRNNNKTIHTGGYLKQPIKAAMFCLPQFRKHVQVLFHEHIQAFSTRTLQAAPSVFHN